MARYQLLVTEPNKAPRTIEVAASLALGRSRGSDVVIEDDEVSREQMQFVLTGDTLSLRSIGKTNVTSVDGKPVPPGDTVPLRVGSRIAAGRTVIAVLAAPLDADASPATVVAKTLDAGTRQLPPGPRGQNPPPPKQVTRDSEGGTLELPRGPRGQNPPPPKPVVRDSQGGTLELPRGPRGQTPPPTPPPATPDSDGGTLQLPRGPRGQTPPPTPPPATPDSEGGTLQLPRGPRGQNPPPSPPPATPDSEGGTLQLPRGPRGQNPPPTPAAQPPVAPAPATPAAAPTPAATPTPAPAPAPDPALPPGTKPPSNGRPRISTIAISPRSPDSSELQEPAQLVAAAVALRPRVFVRGGAMRRCMRITGATARIGRNAQFELVLTDESVSENHAELRFDGQQWTIRDCGSRNGTFAGGKQLEKAVAKIARNTLLSFGTVRALFLVDEPKRMLDDLRHEARALRLLVSTRKLSKDEGREIVARVAREGLSIPEIVLKDTVVDVAAWGEALTATARRTLRDRFLDLFRGVPRPATPS